MTEHEVWKDRTRIVLSPLSAPSILGLMGFAGSTAMAGAHMAGWWGRGSPNELAFVGFFAFFWGGLAQFLAGMWSYRARDAIATAMHGTWGAFWMGFGLTWVLIAIGVVDKSAFESEPLGMWFATLAVATWGGALAAAFENIVLTAVLTTLAAGATAAAIGLLAEIHTATVAGGILFVISAAIAMYLSVAMMVAEAAGKVVLPLGKYKKAANVPGESVTRPIAYSDGMPGVRVGQ